MNEVDRERARGLKVAIVAGLSAIPLVGGPISVVAEEVLDRRRRRVAELGSDVLAEHDAEDVLARLRSDERFGELFVRAAEAAAVNILATEATSYGRGCARGSRRRRCRT